MGEGSADRISMLNDRPSMFKSSPHPQENLDRLDAQIRRVALKSVEITRTSMPDNPHPFGPNAEPRRRILTPIRREDDESNTDALRRMLLNEPIVATRWCVVDDDDHPVAIFNTPEEAWSFAEDEDDARVFGMAEFKSPKERREEIREDNRQRAAEIRRSRDSASTRK